MVDALMSSDINFAVVSGNVVRDPELKATSQGQSVLSFTVASNDEWPGANGVSSRTNFVACQVFGKRADSLSSIIRKGMPVTVSGRLRTDSWEKDGQRRTKTLLSVGEVKLPPRQQGGAQAPVPAAAAPRGEVYDAPGEVQAAISAAFSQPARKSDAYMAGAAAFGGQVYDEEIPF